MIKVIGFDLDDTLWDVVPVLIMAEHTLDKWLTNTVPQLNFTVKQMRTLRHDVLFDRPELAKQITECRRRIIERAMLLSNIPPAISENLSHDAIEIFLEARNKIELFDGAIDVLTKLSKQYQLGALSNGNADVQRIGIGHLFNFTFSAEQVGAPKPAPNLFNKALEHTSTQACEMIYVGDDPLLDVDAAKQLGIHTVWVDRGKQKMGLHAADQIITRISELPSAIHKIAKENN